MCEMQNEEMDIRARVLVCNLYGHARYAHVHCWLQLPPWPLQDSVQRYLRTGLRRLLIFLALALVHLLWLATGRALRAPTFRRSGAISERLR